MIKSGSINQPYFFPYIGFFQLLAKSDVFISLDDVSMIKKGFIHRNYLEQNGHPVRFTIPIKNLSQNKLISETNTHTWPLYSGILWNKIKNCYKNKAFFCQVEEVWSAISCDVELNIGDLSLCSIKATSKFLGLNTQFVRSSEYPNSGLTGQDRIIELCQKLDIKEYWNLPGGTNLYSCSDFLKNGISLRFLSEDPNTSFKKCKNEKFSLSILDILATYPKLEIQTCLIPKR